MVGVDLARIPVRDLVFVVWAGIEELGMLIQDIPRAGSSRFLGIQGLGMLIQDIPMDLLAQTKQFKQFNE